MDVKSYWARARSKPPAVLLVLSASLGAIGRLHADRCSAAGADRGAGSHPAAGTAAPRRHAAAAGGASWSAGRSGATRPPGRQPQSRRIGCRTGSRHRACNNASTGRVSTRRCERELGRAASDAQSAGLGRRSSRRVRDRPCARAPRKRAGSTRGGRRARPHVPGKLHARPSRRIRRTGATRRRWVPRRRTSHRPKTAHPCRSRLKWVRSCPRKCIAADRPRTTSSNRPAAAWRCSTTTAMDCSTFIW